VAHVFRPARGDGFLFVNLRKGGVVSVEAAGDFGLAGALAAPAGAEGADFAGAAGVCAETAVAATREAASGSQSVGDKLFIFMILGDPVCFIQEGLTASSMTGLKDWMPPVWLRIPLLLKTILPVISRSGTPDSGVFGVTVTL
jgi:hypothetical protein